MALAFHAKMMKSLFFVVLTITLVSSARILDETNSPSTAASGAAGTGFTGFGAAGGSGNTGTTAGFGSTGVTGAFGTNGGIGSAGATGGIGGVSGSTGAGVTGASGTNGGIGNAGTNGGGGGVSGTTGAGVTGDSGTNDGVGGAGVASVATGGGAGAVGGSGSELTFFMHDILGGSNPTAKLITGIVNNPAINGQIPFAKPNGAILSVDQGVPTDSSNDAIINNNNLPFLTGLSGTTSNIIQNSNGNSNLPVVNGAQAADASTIQKLMFGTMTAIDDELTEGPELRSGLVGRAQGFYVASSVDGTSSTMAFTALFHGGGYVDSLSFFGIHRNAVSENQLAVMGGTGKYVNAQGFATVKTHPATASSQNTDGLETLLEFTVYLSY